MKHGVICLDHLDVRLCGVDDWEMLREVRLYLVEDGAIVDRKTVDTGFRHDFASIPYFFAQRIVPKGREEKIGAVIHDKLCREAETREDRERADRWLRAALVATEYKPFGVTFRTRWLRRQLICGAVESYTKLKYGAPGVADWAERRLNIGGGY